MKKVFIALLMVLGMAMPTTGADISHVQPWTGYIDSIATATSPWADVTHPDYGAVSGTDIAVAAQAAATALTSTGGTIFVPDGSWTLSKLTLPSNVKLVCSPGATISQTGSETYMVGASGSVGSAVLLTANAAAGSATLTVADTTGLTADDYIFLYDAYAYDPGGNSTYRSGESARIKTVDDATTLTLYGPIYGSWYAGGAYDTTNSAAIRKVTYVRNVGVEGCELVGDESTTTEIIRFSYTQGSVVKSCTFPQSGSAAIMIESSDDFLIDGNSATDLLDDTANGHAGYAVSPIGPCSNGRIVNNKWRKCRHGFTTMGNVYGMPHSIVVANNNTDSTTLAAIDTHPAGEDILITGNTVINSIGNGIHARSRKTTISNNTINGVTGHGIGASDAFTENITISENTVNNASSTGVYVREACPGLTIKDNILINTGGNGISLFPYAIGAVANVSILNNIIKGFGLVTADSVGIYTTSGNSTNTTGAVLTGNIIDPLTGSAAYGMRTLFLTLSSIRNNLLRGTITTTDFALGSANYNSNNSRADDGGRRILYARASATLTGASTAIATAIPTGAKILGSQLRVDTAVTSGDGATSWAAAYSGGATQAIATGKAFTKSTKADALFDHNAASGIASATTSITITPNAGTFSGGVISAIVEYEQYQVRPDAS